MRHVLLDRVPSIWLRLGVGLGVLLCWSPEVGALDPAVKASILQVSREAKQDYDAGRYLDASLKFQMAFERAEVPILALHAARASLRAGDWVAAERQYQAAANASPNELWLGDKQLVAREQARYELLQLEAKLPRLVVDIQDLGPDVPVSVSIDERTLILREHRAEQSLNPGAHVVVFRYGDDHLSREFTAKQGERLTLTLRFAQPIQESRGNRPLPGGPSPPEERTDWFEPSGEPDGPMPVETRRVHGAPYRSGTWRTVGWVGVGVGAASLAVGSITAVMVETKYRNHQDACPGGTCQRGAISQGEIDSYNLLRTTSTAALIAGGVLGAAGTTILLTNPDSGSKAAVGLRLTATGAYLRGALW